VEVRRGLRLHVAARSGRGARNHIKTYAYLWRGVWVHCADHAIYTNHSDIPNSYGIYPNDDVFGWSVAKRDIAAGEEITEDYRTFCEDWKDLPFLESRPEKADRALHARV
jgi:uncharacterized protein